MRFATRHGFVIGYLILLAVLVGALLQLREAVNDQKRISVDTNLVVKKEIPRLEKTNEGLNYMLNEQAVPAIVFMLDEIERLGGDPPKVLLNPTEPSFDEQQEGR